MRKTFLLTILIMLLSFTSGFSADTDFFGSIESRVTSNDNLEDADKDANDAMDYVDTKLVLGIESSFNEYLRGIAVFEVGSVIWGIDGEDYPVGRNTGGSASGDGVNVETKNIYLDIDVPERPINFKCGLMPFDIANGILAGDDAYGASLTVGTDLSATLNMIRIYQESLGTRYNINDDDPDRNENFIDLEVTKAFGEHFEMSALAAYLIDRYNGPEGNELDRDIYYYGLSLSGGSKTLSASLDVIFNAGSIVNSDVLGNAEVDISLDRGYIVDFIAEAEFSSVGFMLECLYASGDNIHSTGDYEGFIIPETSYKTDIAEILTRGVLSDELEGDDDYEAYKYTKDLNNIYFVKGAFDYKFNKKMSTSIAVIYASLAKERTIHDPVKAHKVGTEIDLKIERIIYLADDQQKGLKLELIAAMLFTGDVYNEYDPKTDTIVEGSDIEEYGVRLTYEF